MNRNHTKWIHSGSTRFCLAVPSPVPLGVPCNSLLQSALGKGVGESTPRMNKQGLLRVKTPWICAPLSQGDKSEWYTLILREESHPCTACSNLLWVTFTAMLFEVQYSLLYFVGSSAWPSIIARSESTADSPPAHELSVVRKCLGHVGLKNHGATCYMWRP